MSKQHTYRLRKHETIDILLDTAENTLASVDISDVREAVKRNKRKYKSTRFYNIVDSMVVNGLGEIPPRCPNHQRRYLDLVVQYLNGPEIKDENPSVVILANLSHICNMLLDTRKLSRYFKKGPYEQLAQEILDFFYQNREDQKYLEAVANSAAHAYDILNVIHQNKVEDPQRLISQSPILSEIVTQHGPESVTQPGSIKDLDVIKAIWIKAKESYNPA